MNSAPNPQALELIKNLNARTNSAATQAEAIKIANAGFEELQTLAAAQEMKGKLARLRADYEALEPEPERDYAPEAGLEARVKDYLKSLKARKLCWYIKPAGGPYNTTTVDFFVCYRGFFVALELKRPGTKTQRAGKLRPIQAIVLEEIKEAGGISAVITRLDQLKTLLSDIDKAIAMVI